MSYVSRLLTCTIVWDILILQLYGKSIFLLIPIFSKLFSNIYLVAAHKCTVRHPMMSIKNVCLKLFWGCIWGIFILSQLLLSHNSILLLVYVSQVLHLNVHCTTNPNAAKVTIGLPTIEASLLKVTCSSVTTSMLKVYICYHATSLTGE